MTLASDGGNEAFTKGNDIHAVQQRKDRGVKDTTGPALPPVTGNYKIRFFFDFSFFDLSQDLSGPRRCMNQGMNI